MTHSSEDARRQALRQMLTLSGAAGSDAAALAAAFFGIWQQMAGQLEPMIGVRGVNVLFGRALHLTGRSFPWLPTATAGNSAAPLEVLQTCLTGRDAAEARDAGETLLLTFTGLLTGMVGESLTARLLGPGWTVIDTQAQSKIPVPAPVPAHRQA